MDIMNTYAKYEHPVSCRKSWPMFKNRSMVMVKVTRSKFMLSLERPCQKEHINQI